MSNLTAIYGKDESFFFTELPLVFCSTIENIEAEGLASFNLSISLQPTAIQSIVLQQLEYTVYQANVYIYAYEIRNCIIVFHQENLFQLFYA